MLNGASAKIEFSWYEGQRTAQIGSNSPTKKSPSRKVTPGVPESFLSANSDNARDQTLLNSSSDRFFNSMSGNLEKTLQDRLKMSVYFPLSMKSDLVCNRSLNNDLAPSLVCK